MENVFDYEDIQLVPAKAVVESRSECDTSIEFGGRTFKLPVVPANMQTIVDEKIAGFLAENNYFILCIDSSLKNVWRLRKTCNSVDYTHP